MDNNEEDIFEHIKNEVALLRCNVPIPRPAFPKADATIVVPIWKHMKTFAAKNGIFIQLVSIIRNDERVLGRSLGPNLVELKTTLPFTFMTSALIHEIAHSLLHHGEDKTPKSIREVEAETIAFLVMRHFGVDMGDWSFKYIANYTFLDELTITDVYHQSKDKIKQTTQTILGTQNEHSHS